MDCDQYFNIDIKKTIAFIHNETLFKSGFTINKKTGKKNQSSSCGACF